MNPFVYNNPTKVIFEQGAEKHLPQLLKEQKSNNILIVYGGKSAEKSGLLQRTFAALEKENITYSTLNGIIPNPLLSKVEEGIKLGIEKNIDFIIAIGGGSVIDTAKAIGVGILNKGNVWDFFEGKRQIEGSIPIGTILTIPAAGSEMSTSSVITKDEGLLKRSINSSYIICKFALLDPMLTTTLPIYQTQSGCVDIMMHTMERYFNNTTNLELTDSLSESLIRTVMKYSKILQTDEENIEARWNIMWAGSLSHNGLMNCGNNRGDWSTHGIEHELGGMFDVTHGAGLSAIWATWARYIVEIIPHRFEKFAINVLDINKNNQLETALEGIKQIEDFFESINMPTNIQQLDINPTKEQIEEMAIKATTGKTVGSVKKLTKEDIIIILNEANKNITKK